MALYTSLFDLPNELFPHILQYLSSIDIFKAFADIQSDRIQVLISPFLTAIDLSKESAEWIENSIPQLSRRNELRALRLEMNRLSLIPDDLLSGSIQSMDVINSHYDFPYSNEIMTRLRQNLQTLTLKSCAASEVNYEDLQFLQSDSHLIHLTISYTIFLYSNIPLQTCTSLTYLSIVLEGIALVFTFLNHLPNLRELKVLNISEECYPQSPPDTNGVQACKVLRTVTFTGWIKYFDHLETFFETFGSSIECLTLDIVLMHWVIDGTRLEHHLLDKMPHLFSLRLSISSVYVDSDPIQIETFQTFAWEQINPIVYWYDVHAQQHLLFTLPYRSDKIERLSNECVSTCVSNRAVSLRFPHVRTVSLINTTPLNLETILFIEKCFPRVNTVELTERMIHPLAEDDRDERGNVLSLNEDLLFNATVQILSVTKFCIRVYRQAVDYKTVYRFLCLFPNLVELQLNLGHPLLCDLARHKNEDDRVATAFARITQLKISQSREEDKLTDIEMRSLFPNVKTIRTTETEDSG